MTDAARSHVDRFLRRHAGASLPSETGAGHYYVPTTRREKRRRGDGLFIAKDLGGDLRRALDAYLKDELLSLDALAGMAPGRLAERVALAADVRRLGREAIAPLERAEDARKALWLKKPSVLETHYGVTLDRVPPELYPAVAANDAQREEWVRLFRIEEVDGSTFPLTAAFLRANPFLVLDTRFFGADFTARLLASFADLDAALDGLLVRGENFQALTLLQERYRGRVDCVYIDPPYNTSDEDFVYKNSYRRPAWLSLMRERAALGRELLSEKGVFMVAIDDTETAHLRLLLDEVFGAANHVTTFAVEVNPAGQNLRPGVPARSHDYCHVYARDAALVRVRPRPLTPEEAARYTECDLKGRFLWDNLRRRGGNSRPEDRPNQWFPLYVDLERGRVGVEPFPESVEVWPVDPRGERRIWRVSPEGARREIAAGEVGVLARAGRIEVVKKSRMPPGKKPKTLWKDPAHSATSHGSKLLDDLVGSAAFTYPKSVHLVRDCLDAWAGRDAVVLDYFAGSGTTAHAVIDLNRADGGRRKYVLVEVGDHFDTVLKPRIMKVVYSPHWRRRRPTRRDAGTSHFFQYLHLESFEEALRRGAGESRE